VECRDETKFQLVEETKKRLSQTYPINTIDGVRVDFGDSWGLVRASNTQPALVLRFEAPSAARLKEIRHVIETILSEAAVVIGHLPLKV
jgi:phosphomannomutase/phosphoglucomutase